MGKDYCTWERVIARYGYIEKNKNGILLLGFCTQNNFLITNTIFFTYPDSVICNNVSLDKETTWQQKAAKSLKDPTWRDRNISLGTKPAVYNAVVLQTLLYGGAAWVTYHRLVIRFHLTCLKCLTSIKR